MIAEGEVCQIGRQQESVGLFLLTYRRFSKARLNHVGTSTFASVSSTRTQKNNDVTLERRQQRNQRNQQSVSLSLTTTILSLAVAKDDPAACLVLPAHKR
jgi:hypothetical protein